MIIPQQWIPPCGDHCTRKYATLKEIPWRVYCKKGCDANGETWEECLSECDALCYKDPVFKDWQWTARFDRSPGVPSYSEACFHACVSGCGFKYEMSKETIDQVRPNRPLPPKPPPVEKPPRAPATKPNEPVEDVPNTSA